ncbi:putative pentatricopeptide repeat-containing protein At3g01580 [Eucalyptus grandis]|uniref:putative pentatricopeptide repeat-containing protein At3g01580 n=1 Tax=Eucalyptus grandis TaxID=71139 RepID=UPI00192EF941|nr:putative pentatricopeptide repeat-containing protein At3g01580 [Eucalyptus grandis]
MWKLWSAKASTLITHLNPFCKFFYQTKRPIQFARTQESKAHLAERCSPQHFSDRSYSYLLSRLKSPLDLLEAKRLHAVLIVRGVFAPGTNGGFFGSQLVDVYVRVGRLGDARDVFEEVPKKGNVAYNAILRGLVSAERFSEAIDFFRWMLREEVVPDNFTYPIVLKACSGLNDLEAGRNVCDLIEFNETKFNAKRNVYVECAMIDMFAKCGSLAEARNVFEEMPRKDLASWSAMIGGTVRNGDSLEALCLLKRMRQEGLKPDSVTVASILPACGKLGDAHNGMALQGFAVRSGFESDIYVSNALMDMYGKCGLTDEAHAVFRSIVNKDSVSWSALIAGYSQNGEYRRSVELYLNMNNAGIKTNVIIASSVLPGLGKRKLLKHGKEMHGYIIKQGFESDGVIGSALIDMYMNCGTKRAAENILYTISFHDIAMFNSMIVGYSINGNPDLALGIFWKIWKFDLTLNAVTILSILPVCTEIGNVTHGKEIHGYTIRTSIGGVVSVENSLIEMYCKGGHLELGFKVFNGMMEKNIMTYNTIICAHANHGLGEQALSFFEEMRELRMRPNKVTFIGLLSACSHAGLVEEGWHLFDAMRSKYKIMPEREHYSCMVDLLGRAGQLDCAFNFIKEMPMEPDISVWGSLLSACRAHDNVVLASFVGRKIIDENLIDPGHHMLLYNIYASSQRWRDASIVRAVIKEKGLLKTPGRSWIQIGFGIHTFHARGQIHPESDNIYRVLDLLLLDMKDKGYALDQGSSSEDLVEKSG